MLIQTSQASVALMGHPTDDVTSAIKDAVDIVQLVSEYIRVEPFGSKYRALCPFHQDTKPSLQIDPQFQNYRCWACQKKGDVFTFVQEMERISFAEAKSRLAARAGIKLSSGGSDFVDSKGALYQVLAWAEKEFQKYLQDPRTGREARQYLAERHLTDGTCAEHGLGASPAEFHWLMERARAAQLDEKTLVRAGLAKIGQKGTAYDTFRGRILIPIRDTAGRVIGFGGRLLPVFDDGESPKYLNSPATDVYNKSSVLYGLDVATQAWRQARPGGANSSPSMVVMEGYMDCLMAYQSGVRTCVATCGTALTAEHVKKLRGYTNRVVLMFDGDAAGQKAARESIGLFLESELDLRLCMLPDGLDPCDFLVQQGGDALRQRIDQAPDALEYVIADAQQSLTSEGLAGRSLAVDRVLETFATMPADLRSEQRQRFDLAVNRVAESFRMQESVLRERIHQLRQDRRVMRDRPRVLSEGTPEVPVGPISLREKAIAELLVVMPSQAGPLLALHGAEMFRHPHVQAIARVCQQVCDERGSEASTDMVRDRLSDSRLEALLLDLLESAPKGEAFERTMIEVCRTLEEDLKRRELVDAGRLGPSARDEDHLALLRELRKKSAI